MHVREQSGLFPGTEVEFVVDGQDVRIVRAESNRRERRGETLVRRLRGSASVQLSTEEIMSLTRSDEP
jgi:bifunctional DNA-binding transcriptional regulator/antitoxin component of YhaV-PrlF toxin-antitoxin module